MHNIVSVLYAPGLCFSGANNGGFYVTGFTPKAPDLPRCGGRAKRRGPGSGPR